MYHSILPIGADRRPPLQLQQVFETLKNGRRRFVLLYLADEERDVVPVSDLVNQLTACETGEHVGEYDANRRTAVYVSLHQTHLPRMERFDLIRRDSDDRTVELTDSGRFTARYLERTLVGVREWTHVFLAVSLLAALLGAGSIWNLAVPVPGPEIVTALTATAFLLLSLAYYREIEGIDVDPCLALDGDDSR